MGEGGGHVISGQVVGGGGGGHVISGQVIGGRVGEQVEGSRHVSPVCTVCTSTLHINYKLTCVWY